MRALPLGVLRNGHGERLDYAFLAATRGGAAAGTRRPALVICHGVTSNKDRPYLIALAEGAAAAGIAALRFCFAGNGASEGRYDESTPTKEVDDLGAAIDALARDGCGPIAVAGHSMGSAVALLRAARDERVRALVSLAGMFHVARFFERHFGRLPYGAPMRGLPQCPWNAALAQDAARLGSLTAAAARVAIPWLVVHAENDDMVPIDDANAALAAAARPADAASVELVTLAGTDHRFAGGIPALVAAVVPWLERQLARP